jgi:2,3-bisphosphoglycerate-independent phosphoglycerate mutase
MTRPARTGRKIDSEQACLWTDATPPLPTGGGSCEKLRFRPPPLWRIPMNPLKRLAHVTKPAGPVVLIIMDGVGIGRGDAGDMVAKASKPNMDWLKANAPNTRLKAHGSAVGMPTEGDMGNSEVGHNAIGAGRVFDQGASLVINAIRDGSMFEGKTWKDLSANATKGGTLHFIGLLSDGNVHSHIEHIEAMLRAGAQGRHPPGAPARAARRPRRSADFRAGLRRPHRGAAEGTVHRWLRLCDRLWRRPPVHHHGPLQRRLGDGGTRLENARAGRGTHVRLGPAAIENLPRRARGRDRPGPAALRGRTRRQGRRAVQDGDSVILINFRGDRAMELCAAFEQDAFDKFDRVRRPKVLFAGMMEYDGDLHIPGRYLVAPPGHLAHPGRIPCQCGAQAARGERDAEVRPRDLLLQRQPHRQVQRVAGGLRRDQVRPPALRAAPVDEGRRRSPTS